MEEIRRQSKVGKSEIAFDSMGFKAAMAAANMATSNEEDTNLYKARKMLDFDLLLI